VYIRTDGVSWEVEARAGGGAGRSKIYPCPGRQSAEILAGAWMGGESRWQVVAPRPADADPPRTAAQPAASPGVQVS